MANSTSILKIIRQAILVGDYELISMLIKYFEIHHNCEQVENVLFLLRAKEFSHAIEKIDGYLMSQRGQLVVEDIDLAALNIELDIQKSLLKETSDSIVECQRLVDEFNHTYQLKLGELIRELLALKCQIAEIDSSKFGDPISKEDYFQAQKDYDDFANFISDQKERKLEYLSEKNLEKLKEMYRKASLICHPDRVSEDRKEEATEIFKNLNSKYRENNLEAVESILSFLEHGTILSSTIPKSEQLKSKLIEQINIVKNKLETLKLELYNIQTSDEYVLISNLKDLNSYFEDRERDLTESILLKKDALKNLDPANNSV